jgi:hypothetical protein
MAPSSSYDHLLASDDFENSLLALDSPAPLASTSHSTTFPPSHNNNRLSTGADDAESTRKELSEEDDLEQHYRQSEAYEVTGFGEGVRDVSKSEGGGNEQT